MNTLSINELIQLQKPPAVFTPGESEFWTDAYIATQMLAAHLDPTTDVASRRPETIQRTVEWIVEILGLKQGDSVLDLGCGPGLYASRFAEAGLAVTGVDFSQNSIRYAQDSAQKKGLAVSYRCQNYLELDEQNRYDAVLLIFGDYCPLNPQQRRRLLENVRRALKPGGAFVLDVSMPNIHKPTEGRNNWYAVDKGFWRPTPHLVLEQHFGYPGDVYLDQYIVIEAEGKQTVYRNWFQDFTAQRIRAEMEENGFAVASLWGDLSGSAYQAEGDWIGVVARRV